MADAARAGGAGARLVAERLLALAAFLLIPQLHCWAVCAGGGDAVAPRPAHWPRAASWGGGPAARCCWPRVAGVARGAGGDADARSRHRVLRSGPRVGSVAWRARSAWCACRLGTRLSSPARWRRSAGAWCSCCFVSAFGRLDIDSARRVVRRTVRERSSDRSKRRHDRGAAARRRRAPAVRRMAQRQSAKQAEFRSMLSSGRRLALSVAAALESLVALRAGLGAVSPASRGRVSAPPLGPLQGFRFNDQLVWGLIAGLAHRVRCRRSTCRWRAGRNLLVFFGALYALRGFGVALVVPCTGALAATLVGRIRHVGWPVLSALTLGVRARAVRGSVSATPGPIWRAPGADCDAAARALT